jgi:hypothetical protein
VSAVTALVLVAGLSEAAGRLLPVIARRAGTPPRTLGALLVVGGLVEAAMIALWPATAWVVAGWVAPVGDGGLTWSATEVAPLVLAGVIAFPLLGPALHLALLLGVGAGLASALAGAGDLDWAVSAGCVAVAAVGWVLAVEALRRLFGVAIALGRVGPVA